MDGSGDAKGLITMALIEPWIWVETCGSSVGTIRDRAVGLKPVRLRQSKKSFHQESNLILELDEAAVECTRDILGQRDYLDQRSQIPWVVPTFVVIKGENEKRQIRVPSKLVDSDYGTKVNKTRKKTKNKVFNVKIQGVYGFGKDLEVKLMNESGNRKKIQEVSEEAKNRGIEVDEAKALNQRFDNKLKIILTKVRDDGVEVVIFDDEIVKEGSKKLDLTFCGYVGYKMSYQELRYNIFRMWGKFRLNTLCLMGMMCNLGNVIVSFARVLIEVKACKGLLDQIEIVYKNNDNMVIRRKFVKFEYDWNPHLCSFCLVFGHKVDKCMCRPKTMEDLEALKEEDRKEEEANKRSNDEEFVQVNRKKLPYDKQFVKDNRRSANKFSILIDHPGDEETKEDVNKVHDEEDDVFVDLNSSCQGLGKLSKQNVVRDLINDEKLSIYSIFETRLKGPKFKRMGDKLMRIEQYFLMIDYSLWEVIKNSNKVLKRHVGTVKQIYEPTSVEEKLDRKNEKKARGTLLMALPNKDQLKFQSYQDEKLLMEAIEKSQSNSPQLSKEDLEQIDPDDQEEIDVHWEMAMLTIRARRFIKITCRNLDINGQKIGFDRSKVECFNCHKNGHSARECRAPKNQENRGREYGRKTIPVQNPIENALIAQDRIGGYDWSYQAKEEHLTNYALMALTSLGSSSSSDSEENVKSISNKGYHAVPPPYPRNYIPSKPDLTFIDEQVESDSVDVVSNVASSDVKSVESKHESVDVKNKGVYSTIETKPVRKNNFSPLIIEDWNSNDESEVEFVPKVEVKTVRPSIKKIKFVKSAREKVEKVETP
uniref:CCHC-type domain-containing protein n=1 Tax=Tanacetum cinerariifolium TaxID=118510 RepID=A0A6L2K1B9_TANCI|nr:hypothetical protein [Tanacetum cinerariifolium]